MPFKSRSQARVCYSTRPSSKNWDCDKWASETPSLCCLPEKKGRKPKCRKIRKGEPIKGPIQTGPRGGKFFTLTEKDSKNKVLCTWKIYVSHTDSRLKSKAPSIKTKTR